MTAAVSTAEASADDHHYGPIGMRERMTELGGELRLETSPGRGTTVMLDLPCRRRSR